MLWLWLLVLRILPTVLAQLFVKVLKDCGPMWKSMIFRQVGLHLRQFLKILNIGDIQAMFIIFSFLPVIML